jgi:hypothetical protein
VPKRFHSKQVIAVAVTCALAGAGAGIAGSFAAPKSRSAGSGASGTSGATGPSGTTGGHWPGGRGGDRRRPFGRGDGIGFGGPPVHADVVMANPAGTGFISIAADFGKLKSADGTTLTIAEGTDKAVYKTVDIDVGDAAKVQRDHKTAKLSDLVAGDYVQIVKDPKGYEVRAEDAATHKADRDRGPRGMGGPGGPPGGGPGHRFGHFGPGGPHPGAPGGPSGASGATGQQGSFR